MCRISLPNNLKNVAALKFFRLHMLLFFCLLLWGCSGGVYHTVRPGQTLYRISKTYGIDEAELARINNVKDPTQLKVGTRLYVPGAGKMLSVPVVKPKPPTQQTQTAQQQAPKKTPPPAAPAKAQPKASNPPPKKQPQPAKKATSVEKLGWPLKGKVVRSFSRTAKAGSGRGIEIAVSSGTEVKAAEAGRVIYSGDGINGYGHLIILQHENDLFTVYGFNQRNIAKQGDFVSKGERIAFSGVPPAGGQPRLHFEVRVGKQPVDPILYLP
ncbi:MAG: peptidase M23 [Desulfuromonas sp.]|nr:MAG: peptidase M23 [Desulfuromonas sp.]